MKSQKELVYHLLFVPGKCLLKYVGFVTSFAVVLIIIIYSVGSKILLDHSILKVDKSELASVLNYIPKSNSLIYDKNKKIISEVYNEYHHFVKYKDIPPLLIKTIIATEDRKFFKHYGIDLFGIIRAIKSYVINPSKGISQGASTITQQIVKNLLLSNEKTFTRKIREIVLAIYLEKIVTKEKLLEIYCNHLFLGNGAYGVSAAARKYFGKTLKELNKFEIATIAGLFQSPTKYNPSRYPKKSKMRQLYVLNAMKSQGLININEYLSYKNKKIQTHLEKSSKQNIAPYFTDYIIEQAQNILEEKSIKLKDSGLKIYTTLDSRIQRIANKSVKNSEDIFKMMARNTNENISDKEIQAAMLVIDRKTGQIVSMVGGVDYNNSQFNRAIQARRSPASSFKSIIYSLAIEKGAKWNNLHIIAPITVGNYRPKTSMTHNLSESTMLKAFYKSFNSPAVEIGNNLGVKNVNQLAYKMGIDTPLKDEAATLLGGSEVTLLDMAKVYTTIANYGKRIDPIAITQIENKNGKIIYQAPEIKERSKRVLSQRTGELMVEGLKQVIRRGTGYLARPLVYKAAGKTGTSNQSKDNWFCGFTNDLVTIAWIGNDDQKTFKSNITASNTATKLWTRFNQRASQILQTKNLKRPTSIKMVRIDPRFGHIDKQGVPMYFTQGSVPTEKISDFAKLDKGLNTRISLDEF